MIYMRKYLKNLQINVFNEAQLPKIGIIMSKLITADWQPQTWVRPKGWASRGIRGLRSLPLRFAISMQSLTASAQNSLFSSGSTMSPCGKLRSSFTITVRSEPSISERSIFGSSPRFIQNKYLLTNRQICGYKHSLVWFQLFFWLSSWKFIIFLKLTR